MVEIDHFENEFNFSASISLTHFSQNRKIGVFAK